MYDINRIRKGDAIIDEVIKEYPDKINNPDDKETTIHRLEAIEAKDTQPNV